MISKEEFITLARTNADGDTLLTAAVGPGQALPKEDLLGRPTKLLGCLPSTLTYWDRYGCNILSCGVVKASAIMASTKMKSLDDACRVLVEKAFARSNHRIAHGKTLCVLTVEGDTTGKRVVCFSVLMGPSDHAVFMMDTPTEGAEDYLSAFYDDTFSMLSYSHLGMGVYHLQNIKRQLDVSCPVPTGWVLSSGFIKGNLTPKLDVRIVVYYGQYVDIMLSLEGAWTRTEKSHRLSVANTVKNTISALYDLFLRFDPSAVMVKEQTITDALMGELWDLPQWAKEAVEAGLKTSIVNGEQDIVTQRDHIAMMQEVILKREQILQRMRIILLEAPWTV